MGAGLSGAGYLRETALNIGKSTRRRLSQRQLTIRELDRVLDFHFVDTSARKFFRSSAGDQSELAENLLLPFAEDDPEPDIKHLLKNFLIQRHFRCNPRNTDLNSSDGSLFSGFRMLWLTHMDEKED